MHDIDILKHMNIDIWLTSAESTDGPARIMQLSTTTHAGLLVLPEDPLPESARTLLKKMLRAFNMRCQKDADLSQPHHFALLFGESVMQAVLGQVPTDFLGKTVYTDPQHGRLFMYPDLQLVVDDIACKKRIWHDISAYLSN